MTSGFKKWNDQFVVSNHKKNVYINTNGDFENGKILYMEPEWILQEFLNAASKRLELFPTAQRVFNVDGVEIDDCMMIVDDDILFLSNGDDFCPPVLESQPTDENDSKENSNRPEWEKIPAVIGGYRVGKIIGRGAFGEVRVGEHQLTGEKVALKFLRKSDILSIGAAERTATEIQCLSALKHNNIIRLQQQLDSNQHVVLVFELMEGGDLYSYLGRQGTTAQQMALSEEEARPLFHQVLSAVGYAHNQHICHRDLKLENILLKSVNSLALVKIADFGLSDFYRPGLIKKSYCGTLSFLAPEVFKGTSNAGPPLDIWSLGVILFAILCGRLPFDYHPAAANAANAGGGNFNNIKGGGGNNAGNNSSQKSREMVIRSKILAGQYKVDERLGPEAKDLIRRMLKLDPTERASIPEIFNHVWLRPIISNTIADLTPLNSSTNNNSNGSYHGSYQQQLQLTNGKEEYKNNISNSTTAITSISNTGVVTTKDFTIEKNITRHNSNLENLDTNGNSAANGNGIAVETTNGLTGSSGFNTNSGGNRSTEVGYSNEDASNSFTIGFGGTNTVTGSPAPTSTLLSSNTILGMDENSNNSVSMLSPVLSNTEPTITVGSGGSGVTFGVSVGNPPQLTTGHSPIFKLVPLRRKGQENNGLSASTLYDEMDDMILNSGIINSTTNVGNSLVSSSMNFLASPNVSGNASGGTVGSNWYNSTTPAMSRSTTFDTYNSASNSNANTNSGGGSINNGSNSNSASQRPYSVQTGDRKIGNIVEKQLGTGIGGVYRATTPDTMTVIASNAATNSGNSNNSFNSGAKQQKHQQQYRSSVGGHSSTNSSANKKFSGVSSAVKSSDIAYAFDDSNGGNSISVTGSNSVQNTPVLSSSKHFTINSSNTSGGISNSSLSPLGGVTRTSRSNSNSISIGSGYTVPQNAARNMFNRITASSGTGGVEDDNMSVMSAMSMNSYANMHSHLRTTSNTIQNSAAGLLGHVRANTTTLPVYDGCVPTSTTTIALQSVATTAVMSTTRIAGHVIASNKTASLPLSNSVNTNLTL